MEFTEEAASLLPADPEASTPDPELRRRVQRIAAQLAIPRPRRDPAAHRGAGTLGSLPYRGGSDEVDLDRTIEILAERPFPEDEDIIVRDRVKARRSLVLAIDVSGSMRGEKVRTAAATVGALAGQLSEDSLGIIAFWSDAAILHTPGKPLSLPKLLDTLLALPARGLTNVTFPLELAAQQLQKAPARDARIVLLSDCVHNAGPDPRRLASGLPRLDVLLDATGEKDLDLGRELTAAGRGMLRVIRHHRDVVAACEAVFAR